MAITTRDILKKAFVTGAYPTQQDFWNWLDSFYHKNDKIAIDNIEGLYDVLNERNDALIETVNTIIIEAQKELLLERRITLSMQTSEQIIPIGETMTIYGVKTSNVKTLSYKAIGDDEWEDISTDGSQLDILLNGDGENNSPIDYQFRVTPISVLQACSIYLFAKIKLD